MSQADKDKVEVLRQHWKGLRIRVKEYFDSQTVSTALSAKGLSGLRIQGRVISLIFREKKFRDALASRDRREYIVDMLEACLDEKVQLRLLVESGTGAVNDVRAARPAPANADPMKDLDALIMSELNAQRLNMQQERALLRALDQAKE